MKRVGENGGGRSRSKAREMGNADRVVWTFRMPWIRSTLIIQGRAAFESLYAINSCPHPPPLFPWIQQPHLQRSLIRMSPTSRGDWAQRPNREDPSSVVSLNIGPMMPAGRHSSRWGCRRPLKDAQRPGFLCWPMRDGGIASQGANRKACGNLGVAGVIHADVDRRGSLKDTQ